jgi:hypothetical protein
MTFCCLAYGVVADTVNDYLQMYASTCSEGYVLCSGCEGVWTGISERTKCRIYNLIDYGTW